MAKLPQARIAVMGWIYERLLRPLPELRRPGLLRSRDRADGTAMRLPTPRRNYASNCTRHNRNFDRRSAAVRMSAFDPLRTLAEAPFRSHRGGLRRRNLRDAAP